MLKKLFSRAPSSLISLFLGMDSLAVCILQEGSAHLLAEEKISSDTQWEKCIADWTVQYKLQKSLVAVVVSRDFYQTFDIDKPLGSESEIVASLPFAIKDLLTESAFDVVADYYDRPFMQHKSEQITAVCIAKSKVIEIRDMLLAQSLHLTEITIEELALARLLGNSDEVNLLLSQHSNELILTVVKAGQLLFSHRLRGFNELLALPLLDVEEALLDGLSLELQRVLDYINSQLRLTAIAHIYLAVICPDIDLLAEKLGLYLAKKVIPFGEKNQYDYHNILAYGALIEGKSK